VRVIGIDLGSRRIGVAVSDLTATLASPLTVVARSGDLATDYRTLASLVIAEGAERVVVGLPLALSGTVGRAAQAAIDEAAAMATVVGVPVETFDERLTTVSADRALLAQGVRAPARRRVIDKMAAAVMLQAWLDAAPARAARQQHGRRS
jgi:putative Holliday junction resolvase